MAAYSFRAVGTIASNTNSAALTPGAPAGKQVGDLLLLYTGSRLAGEAAASITGWTQLFADNNGTGPPMEIWARIADGSATDTPSPDWTGVGDSIAWIEAYSGDVYTDLATIIAHIGVVSETGGQASDIPLSSLTITTDDTLVIAYGTKQKTATSNDCTTITAGGGLTKRAQVIQTGTALMGISASMQQTTATNYDGTNFTRNGTDETANATSIVIALLSEEDAVPLAPITLRWRQ